MTTKLSNTENKKNFVVGRNVNVEYYDNAIKAKQRGIKIILQWAQNGTNNNFRST